jgi:drug/metabolite transporter (DMT)-like permease
MLGNVGAFAALGTAICWTITALAFEKAGKEIGSLSLNLLRLLAALVLFVAYSMLFRGQPLPLDASPGTWGWLSLSGLVGFVIGDLFLFQAFILIGARLSMVVYTLVPPLSAMMGFLAIGERLGPGEILGMLLAVAGVGIAVAGRPRAPREVPVPSSGGGSHLGFGVTAAPGAVLLLGVLFAFLGALGQAGGLVLARIGVGSYDAFAATQIRTIAGIAGFLLVFLLGHRWKQLARSFRKPRAFVPLSLGAFFGPFLGVSLGMFALKHTETGVAATLMALVPITIIPPSVVLFGERVTALEIVGTCLAMAGVALIFTA